MKYTLLPLIVCLCLLAVNSVSAQSLLEDPSSQETSTSLTTTPEMWFYLQERRRYENPQLAVHRNAEQRATQRRNRLTAQRWFGISNRRPQANPTPLFGTYSPAWSGNTATPYLWSGTGSPAITVGRSYAPMIYR